MAPIILAADETPTLISCNGTLTGNMEFSADQHLLCRVHTSTVIMPCFFTEQNKHGVYSSNTHPMKVPVQKI